MARATQQLRQAADLLGRWLSGEVGLEDATDAFLSELRLSRTAPHNGTDSSRVASAAVSTALNGKRRAVLGALMTRPMIGYEVELATGLSHQSCSARLNELTRAGLVTTLPEKRIGRYGTKVSVFAVTAAGRTHLTTVP